MATVKDLKATARPKAGKGAARAVRREGRVPGVIYGDSKDPIAISLWPLFFKNVRVYFLGSDDFPAAVKAEAGRLFGAARPRGL